MSCHPTPFSVPGTSSLLWTLRGSCHPFPSLCLPLPQVPLLLPQDPSLLPRADSVPLLPQPEDLEAPKTHHFKVKTFKKVKPCGICRQVITQEGCTCKGEQLSGLWGMGAPIRGMRWLGLGQAGTLLCTHPWGPNLMPCSRLVEDAELTG